MNIARRVVITGFGAITPCGIGWEVYWRAVKNGESVLSNTNSLPFRAEGFNRAGILKDFDPKELIANKKSIKVMSREIQMAVAAAGLAIKDADILPENYDAARIGVTFGTGVINNDLDEIGVGFLNGREQNGEFSMKKFGRDGVRSLFPLWLLKYLPNMPASHISVAYKLQGPSNTITTSFAASAQAVGESFRVIERGDADVMLSGGTDSKINPIGISRYKLLGLLADDKNQSGMTVGEGAGVLILEELESAKKRGAKIYAEIVGYGVSANGDFEKSMSRALEDANVTATDVKQVVANRSGIKEEDEREDAAVRKLFVAGVNRDEFCVKQIIGHLGYAAGAAESIIAALMVNESDKEVVLLNSSGLGGQTVSLVFKKC